MRWIWVLLGLVSLGVGIAGMVLPLVPTVPLFLLASFFFARSSERLHGWLLEHNIFGPPIAAWKDNRAISRQSKILATVSIACTFVITFLIGAGPLVITIQAVVLSAVSVFIWSRPNG